MVNRLIAAITVSLIVVLAAVFVAAEDEPTFEELGIGYMVSPTSNVIAEDGKVWAKIAWGQDVSFEVKSRAIAITEIIFKTNYIYENAGMDVRRLATPGGAERPSGRVVYQYLDIDTKRLPNEGIKSAKIMFKVENEWFTMEEILKDSIRLLQYDGEWQELQTKEIKSDKEYRYFQATAVMFSYFAIVGTSGDGATVWEEVVERPAPTMTEEELIEEYEEEIEEIMEKEGIQLLDIAWMWWTLGIAVVLAALVIYLEVKKKREMFEKKPKEVEKKKKK
jgi:PGF-pre-PGF domain-containing protein